MKLKELFESSSLNVLYEKRVINNSSQTFNSLMKLKKIGYNPHKGFRENLKNIPEKYRKEIFNIVSTHIKQLALDIYNYIKSLRRFHKLYIKSKNPTTSVYITVVIEENDNIRYVIRISDHPMGNNGDPDEKHLLIKSDTDFNDYIKAKINKFLSS